MSRSKDSFLGHLSRLARVLPLLCIAAALLWFLSYGRGLTLEDILSYTPSDPPLAVLFLWLAFAVKSLSLLFPVLLLFAVSGRLFPLPIALLINIVGITLTLSLPYLIGRCSGSDLTVQLIKKHPKLQELRAMRLRNNFFFAFLVRVIGILPCDIVSLYLGNIRLPYFQYITGGILGFMPDLICATILGMKISDVGSPWFWLTAVVNLLICASSIPIYRLYRRRSAKTE